MLLFPPKCWRPAGLAEGAVGLVRTEGPSPREVGGVQSPQETARPGVVLLSGAGHKAPVCRGRTEFTCLSSH